MAVDNQEKEEELRNMVKTKNLEAETWKEYHKNADKGMWLYLFVQIATLMCGMGLGVLLYLDGLSIHALVLVSVGYVALVCSLLAVLVLKALGMYRYPNCERCGASVPQSSKEIQIREQLLLERN